MPTTDDNGCPYCGAPPAEMCTTPAGLPRDDHAQRAGAAPPAPLPPADPTPPTRRGGRVLRNLRHGGGTR